MTTIVAKPTERPVLLNWLFRLNRLEDVPSPSDEVLREMAVVSKKAGADSKRRLFDLLDDAYKYSPPKWMVEREFRKIWHALKADRNSWNIDLAGVDGNVRRLKMQYRAIADRRVRLGLILGVIATRISITGAKYPPAQRATAVEKEVVDFIFGLAGDEPAARN